MRIFGKEYFQLHYRAPMSPANKTVMCRIRCVQDVESKIIDNLENVAKVDKREIVTVHHLAHFLLHAQINAKNKNGFDDKVDDDKPGKGGQELALAHGGKITSGT